MAQHAAKTRSALESSLDVRDKIKAVNEELTGVTCATSLRAPLTSSSTATLRPFIHGTLTQPEFFFFLHAPQQKKRRCARNLTTSFIATFTFHPGLLKSEGLSAFLPLLLQLEALLVFIGQKLGCTNSNGKSCQLFTVWCSVIPFSSWSWLSQCYQSPRLSEKIFINWSIAEKQNP